MFMNVNVDDDSTLNFSDCHPESLRGLVRESKEKLQAGSAAFLRLRVGPRRAIGHVGSRNCLRHVEMITVALKIRVILSIHSNDFTCFIIISSHSLFWRSSSSSDDRTFESKIISEVSGVRSRRASSRNCAPRTKNSWRSCFKIWTGGKLSWPTAGILILETILALKVLFLWIVFI